MTEPSSSRTVLITGGCGFAGRYLTHRLLSEPCRIHIMDRTGFPQRDPLMSSGRIQFHRVDLTAPPGLARMLEQINPDEIYHLAGMANVKHSWEGEALTYQINIIGAVNLLTGLRDSNIRSDVLIVGSGEVYGLVDEREQPIVENHPLNPRSPYSASKVCQEIAATQLSYFIKGKVVFVRPFNHIGPGQLPGFVTSDFARQVAKIERGEQEPVIRVGNVSAKRDFTDVRDTVAGYVLALRHGDNRAVFNVCSGSCISIRHILDRYLELTRAEIRVQVDPDKFRPVDIPLLQGSFRKLNEHTGWTPLHDIDRTLEEILEHWRSRPVE